MRTTATATPAATAARTAHTPTAVAAAASAQGVVPQVQLPVAQASAMCVPLSVAQLAPLPLADTSSKNVLAWVHVCEQAPHALQEPVQVLDVSFSCVTVVVVVVVVVLALRLLLLVLLVVFGVVVAGVVIIGVVVGFVVLLVVFGVVVAGVVIIGVVVGFVVAGVVVVAGGVMQIPPCKTLSQQYGGLLESPARRTLARTQTPGI